MWRWKRRSGHSLPHLLKTVCQTSRRCWLQHRVRECWSVPWWVSWRRVSRWVTWRRVPWWSMSSYPWWGRMRGEAWWAWTSGTKYIWFIMCSLHSSAKKDRQFIKGMGIESTLFFDSGHVILDFTTLVSVRDEWITKIVLLTLTSK